MPLTYEESAALMDDIPFRNRIKVACLKYADFIMAEAASVPAHNTRVRWAQGTMLAPDQAAMVVQPTVVMDPQTQIDGAAITDTALQVTVETSINKML